jgi:predicted phage terminase large subunit-like protein
MVAAAARPRPVHTPDTGPRKTKRTFKQYVAKVKPDFVWYRHAEVLADVLQECADGLRDRLIIQMPPRHGKTEEVTQLFGSYWLDEFPDEWVGLVSYGAEKSHEYSLAAQEYFLTAGNSIASKPARKWNTMEGGGMWATGIRGPATGRSINLGIIDDPVKNDEEAASETIARRNQNWYRSVFYTRLAPSHTCIIIMQTRWPGPADFIGWILEQEQSTQFDDDFRPKEDQDHPEGWHIVSYEALKEPDAGPEIPKSCTLHQDWRVPGEALCPERYPVKVLLQIKRTSQTYFWWALYQQRPQPAGGDAFKREWFLSTDRPAVLRPPPGCIFIRYWDHAATENGGDWTVGLLMGYHVMSGMFYIVDVVRFRKSPGTRDDRIRSVAMEDRLRWGAVTHWGQQEPAAAGVQAAIHFRKLLKQFPVYTEPATGAKPVRGGPVAAAAENGFIRLVKGDWIKPFLDEVETLWVGKYDDQGDCLAGAYNKLVRRKEHGDRPAPPTVGQRTYR